MSDTIDRDKVIQRLEDSVKFFKNRVNGVKFAAWMGATRDAIKLLKAQQPRILTQKDMEDTEPGTVVWCEQRDEIRTYMIPMIKYDDGMFECRFLGASSEAADLANIRFWSARPSDQLREATPW